MHAKIPAEVRIEQINDLPNISFARWDGKYRNAHSKAICRCSIDGFEWSTTVNHLLYTGRGCPQCVGLRRWTALERVEQINDLPNISFIRWDGDYQNSKSKAICRCLFDDFEWSATVNNLVNNSQGCPKCGTLSRVGKQRKPADECIEQINNLPNVSLVRWSDGDYRNNKSEATCRCESGHEWSAIVSNLLHHGQGCPQCAEHGYNPSKPGTLYALRSECGAMVKIGISNKYERRHRELMKATPFDWSCIELIHGDGALIVALEKALHGLTEPAVFKEPFDGYTEWRKWDHRILEWFSNWREMGQCR